MESGRTDLDSADANDATKETPVATHEPPPEERVKREVGPHETATMTKQNGEGELDDGAHEKMLKDESKVSPTKDASEVKFISENGDAKIDIEMVKRTLSGMGKEELMKFANDPFWVRLRWLLFVTFWLLWLAMLAGAIAIIVMAPKCTAPQPKEWWEESPIVQLDASDSPTKDLKGLKPILQTLKEQNVKAISLSSIVKGNLSGHTVDFREIKPQLGQIGDLEDLIKVAKEQGQRIVLELDPNHSSDEHPWFKRSIEKEDPYASYYVWADPRTNPYGGRDPPNNWLSVYGGSAWEWNEHRGQYYLHQFNKSQPDLNYNNPAVVNEFGDILVHWLKLGISGFRLGNTRYLTEDPNLHDEYTSINPIAADDYQSLVHALTRDRPENAAILANWQEIVRNKTEGHGLFALQDDIGADMIAVFNEKKIINLPQNSQFLSTANASINATTLNKGITQWLGSSSWPGWDLNGKHRSLRQRMPADIADSLTLMTLLLPGTPILKLEDTISAKDAFATIAKARSGLTFLHGDTMSRVVNGSVFVYTRLKSGNPGYLVVYHSGEEPAFVDLSTIPQVSEEINVLGYSPNYVQDDETIRTKLPANKVPISPKSTLVLTFVPKA